MKKSPLPAAKKRLGSCSIKGNICYSLYLLLYPDTAIDYVVVHELAHLVEPNHSKRFYDVIEQFLPDWEERRKAAAAGAYAQSAGAWLRKM